MGKGGGKGGGGQERKRLEEGEERERGRFCLTCASNEKIVKG